MVTFVTMFLLILSPLSNNAFLTERYGSLNGGTSANNIRVNIGRISGMKWGYAQQWNGLVIKSWTSDSFISSPPDTIGSSEITTNCTSFSLLNNEYINGYRVIYDLQFPRLLGFHISNNDTYECNVTNAIFNTLTPPINDTGWIIFPNYQLIGFYGKAGAIIDSIAFQFYSILTINSFRTNITGGSGGSDFNELFDIGRINAIYKWGWNTDLSMDGIVIYNWSSDNIPTSNSILFGQDFQTNILCNSFQLTNNEYIIGYRLKKAYRSFHIGYIGFISTLNNIYECGETNVNVESLAWIIPHPTAYLSGISVMFGFVIDSISFQFTYLPSEYNIDCNQNKYGACSEQYIQCMHFINCNINCSNNHSCYNANISCPINANCIIYCMDINGGHSCQGTQIDASMSNSLTIYAEGNHAAFEIKVITDSTFTILNQIGNDGNIFEGINLYSINKWNNIEINCITNICCTCNGIMFYGYEYIEQCNMLSDGTMCESETTPNPTIISTFEIYENTDINVVINYGVIITVTFEYDFSYNDTNVIENILLKVTGNIVNNTVSEQCVKSNDFDIKTHKYANKTIVNATIFVCNVNARDNLLVAIGDNKLQHDLVQKINDDTHLQVSQDVITVQTDVIIVIQDMVTTTDILTTKGEFHQNGKNKLMTVYIVGSIILVGILLICLGVYLYRKYTLNVSVMKDHSNLEMAVSEDIKSQIIEKTVAENEEKSEELMDTNLIDTNEDVNDENEDMYDNNACVNVTVGSHHDIMNVQTESVRNLENEEMKKNILSDGNITMQYDEIDEDMYRNEAEIETQIGYDENITTKGDDMETMQGVNTKGYV
eukprot:503726_1